MTIKIYILLSASIISFSLNGLAQTDSIKKIEIGPYGGVNLFNIGGDQKDGYYAGFTIGAYAQWNLSIKSAVVLAVVNDKKHVQLRDLSGIRKYDYHSLELPLVFRFSPFQYRKMFLEAGFAFSTVYKIKSLYYVTDPDHSGYYPGAGVSAGLGFRSRLGTNTFLSFEIRDEYSLIKTPYSDQTTSNTIYACIHFPVIARGQKIAMRNRVRDDHEPDSIPDGRRCFVKLFYSPQITGRIRGKEEASTLEDTYYGNSHTGYYYDTDLEVGQYGHEFGILLEMAREKHFNFNLGLTYDMQGFHTIPGTVYSGGWGDVLGYYHGQMETTVHYKIDMLSLPIIANYVYRGKNMNFYAGAGLELKRIIHSAVTFGSRSYSYTIGHFKTAGHTQVDPAELFSIANIGIEFPSENRRTFLFIEPNFKCQIGVTNVPLVKHAAQLWSAGCRVGIKF